MKKEPFYKETIDDIIQSYTNFLNSSSMPYSDDKENCAKQAIAFEYYDDKDLINISEPDKTLIVLAIATFLLKYNFPLSYMTEQMSIDIEKIMKIQILEGDKGTVLLSPDKI